MLLSFLVATSLAAHSPAPHVQAAQEAEPKQAHSLADWVQPVPNDLILTTDEQGNSMSLLELVRHYEAMTQVHVMANEESRTLLEHSRLGIEGQLRVPADQVQSFFHTALRGADFALQPLHEGEPRILGLVSMKTQARNTMRGRAPFVNVEELEQLRHFPAMLVGTALTLEHLDVRQLSNAMRTMITDANTEQMLPAGNTNSLVLVGFPDRLYELVQQLRFINEEAGRQSPAMVSELIRLKNADATEIANTARVVFRPQQPERQAQGTAPQASIQIVADVRTNSVILVGKKAEVEEIRSLVEKLDVVVK